MVTPHAVHKESSGVNPAAEAREVSQPAAGKPGSVPGGIRPLRSHKEAFGTREASERKTGSILAPPSDRPKEEPTSDGDRTWTHSSTEGRSRVRMLLSFQRPSHLFKKGVLLRGAPGIPLRVPGRTDDCSALPVIWARSLRRGPGPSRSAGGAGRRSRSRRPAARSLAQGGPRPAESSRRARSTPRACERESSCRD